MRRTNKKQKGGMGDVSVWMRWLPVIVCVPVVLESGFGYLHDQLGWQALAVVGSFVIMSLIVPLQSALAWGMVLLWIVEESLPFDEPGGLVLPVLAALLLLGYRGVMQGILAVAMMSTVYVSPLVEGGRSDFPVSAILTLFGFFVLSAVTGIIWGERQRRTDREQMMLHRSYRRNALRAADQLHNSVANDLVFLGQLLNRPDTPAEDDTVRQARRTVDSALCKVRGLIDELSVERELTADEPTTTGVSGRLCARLSTEDERLRSAGFVGVSLMDEHIDLGWLSQSAERIVTSIVEEAYGNILRHAEAAAGYCVTVDDNGTRLAITVVDEPAARSLQPNHHGTGIARCRRVLEPLGGRLTVINSRQQWSMGVTIPHSYTR